MMLGPSAPWLQRPSNGQPIPLVAPCITDQDRRYLRDRIDNGLLENETEVTRFEQAFAERVGCRDAVAVNSGTSALMIAVRLIKRDKRHFTIPTYTCAASWNAVMGAVCFGLSSQVQYLADSYFDVQTARMTQDDADVLIHMFGTETLTAEQPIIEDYTLSLGGVQYVDGVGVCSTSASKMISTGRGGLIFSDDNQWLEHARELAYYDQQPNGRRASLSLGMTSLQAALGNSQLGQLDTFIARRRELAHRYSERFTKAGIECPDPDCGSVFFRYLIAVHDPASKVAQLAERGIEAGRGVYPPLHQLAGLSDDKFPGATESVNRLLSVPVHPSITDRQADYIAEHVVQVCAP
jgi:perosamine synthetase